MLRQCAAHADGWNAWYAWFDNDVELLPALLADVDAACAAVGRDPASLERSAALLIQLPGLDGLTKYASGGAPPLTGSPDVLADVLHRFASLGIAHVQIVLDPNTSEAITAMAPVLAALDRG
jgi:alkanesulfonate monooxygenase SsuD/methylene tetrahydromethanopterin reductase-like flavin-dependent oxidoreductase (luciferase family)